jgi:hypothetical protein
VFGERPGADGGDALGGVAAGHRDTDGTPAIFGWHRPDEQRVADDRERAAEAGDRQQRHRRRHRPQAQHGHQREAGQQGERDQQAHPEERSTQPTEHDAAVMTPIGAAARKIPMAVGPAPRSRAYGAARPSGA